jgi:NAD(P)-dependent dehydrogenase (short-subunit alcohol dehydrogenase family)
VSSKYEPEPHSAPPAPPTLAGKVCVVTGGGSGIGRAIAIEMSRRAARAVAICDINETGMTETSRLAAGEGSVTPFRCDITKEDSVEKALAEIGERFGGIDVLVNNAGVVDTQMTDLTRLDQIPTDVWDRVFAVNVRGAWLCIKHAFPYLRRSRSASIVNCGSVSSFVAFQGESSYCASKAAVLLLTQSAALDFAEFGIRCTCYCPGTVDTPMVRTQLDASPDPDAAGTELAGMHLTQVPRLAAPEEIARAVCFLASDDASFVNGAPLRVDGGLLAWRGIRPGDIAMAQTT